MVPKEKRLKTSFKIALTLSLLFCLAASSSLHAQAVSLIPLNAGAQMTCQFVNNTGTYSNSQIYVMAISLNSSNQYCYLDVNGNMVPLVAGQNAGSFAIPLSSFAGYQFPTVMTSGRLY